MKILLTGANGQLGWEMTRALGVLGELQAYGRLQADLSRPSDLEAVLQSSHPDVIVNAAAYTQVDAAEQDEAVATTVNADSVGLLARYAKRNGALLLHYSTDYVFDGRKHGAYQEDDLPAPLSAYGRSKLAGEQAIAAEGADSLVFRTTWVYAARGKNFLKTMLRLAGERDTLRVVADQYGAPTPARLLADWSAHALRQALAERRNGSFDSGIYHMTAAGQTSWHGFAEAIVAGARARLPQDALKVQEIVGITTSEYPVAATRPLNSLLDNGRLIQRFGLYRPNWQHALDWVLDDMFGPPPPLRLPDAGT